MAYYFATTLPVAFEEAVQRATDALKAEGFGVITQIDVRATFKDKLGVDFRDHRILGACNPAMAHEALQLEDKVGAMLPCHVVVQALGPRRTEVAANSTRSRARIPRQGGRGFHAKVGTDSTGSWAPSDLRG
ncbi:DUF302 domain-containing protein [Phenylobacterium zucineum]|uniref:DUF302 domain-containing protein n=1 Tax=Phenylobacterium zucineum TaxID=284016 RepID=UPI000311F2DD|nr:DUF302 domain-containing protein [Phenylobacterium zucineum]